VLDLYSRRAVGWSMSSGMTAQLVIDALMMALWSRGKPIQLALTMLDLLASLARDTVEVRQAVHAVYYRNTALSSRITAFLDFMTERLR
jgi:DNA-binding transcriptional LysR family regulator